MFFFRKKAAAQQNLNPDQAIVEAINLFDNEKYEQAIEVCTNIIESCPDYARAYVERAYAYEELDKDQSALADYKKASQLDVKYPGIYDRISKMEGSLGNDDTAASVLWKKLQSQPEHEGMGISPNDFVKCAQHFAAANDNVQAVRVLEAYFANYADKVTTYVVYETAPMRALAKLHIENGDVDKAKQLMQQAVKSPHKCPADQDLWKSLSA